MCLSAMSPPDDVDRDPLTDISASLYTVTLYYHQASKSPGKAKFLEAIIEVEQKQMQNGNFEIEKNLTSQSGQESFLLSGK